MKFTFLIRMVASLISVVEYDTDYDKVVELALGRVPHDIRDPIIEIITQAKSSWAQKRAMLLKRGLLRSTVDELEVLSDIGGPSFVSRVCAG
jgi:translation initiation factor 2-alpha kinase 4